MFDCILLRHLLARGHEAGLAGGEVGAARRETIGIVSTVSVISISIVST